MEKFESARRAVGALSPVLVVELLAGWVAAQPGPAAEALAEFYILGSSGLEWHLGREAEYSAKFIADLEAALASGSQLPGDYGI